MLRRMLWASIFLAACSLAACGSSSGVATHDGGAGAGGASGDAGASGAPGDSGAPPACLPPPTFKGLLHTRWARAFSSASVSGAIGVSDGGLVYGGELDGTLDLGGTSYTASQEEPFLAAYDAAGKLRWSHAYPGAHAWIQAMATDPVGDIAIAGALDKNFDLGTGPLSGAFFLAKLDSSGHALWAKAFGTSDSFTGPVSIAMDAGGRVGLSGAMGSAMDFGGGIVPATSGGFVALFGADGTHVFSHAIATGDARVAFGASGQLLVAGPAPGPIDLGSGPILPPGGSGSFLAALDSSGKQLWAHAWGGASVDAVASRPGGGAVIAGSFADSLDLGLGAVAARGERDMYVAWLDASGTPQRQMTFTAGGADAVSDIAVSSSGETTLLARTFDAVDPGGGPLWPGGMLVARFDAAGKYLASALFGGPSWSSSWTYGTQVALAGTSAFVLGLYQGGPIDVGVGNLPDGQYGRDFVVDLAASSAPGGAHCTPPPVVLPDGSLEVTDDGAGALAADATHVYWSTATELKSVPRAGGATLLLAFGQRDIGGLARVGSRLFYTVTGAGTLESLATSGGTPTVVRSGLDAPGALVANSQTLYFVSGSGADNVESMPLAGAAPKLLATLGGKVELLALDSGAVYVVTPAAQPAETLQRIPLAGGTPTVIATAPRSIDGMASDGQYVYYTVVDTHGVDTTGGDGMLMRVSVTGGAAQTLAEKQGSPMAVQLHAGDVYWASEGFFMNAWTQGSVSRVPKAGGTPDVFAPNLPQPTQLLIDDAGIVWTGSPGICTRPLP